MAEDFWGLLGLDNLHPIFVSLVFKYTMWRKSFDIIQFSFIPHPFFIFIFGFFQEFSMLPTSCSEAYTVISDESQSSLLKRGKK